MKYLYGIVILIFLTACSHKAPHGQFLKEFNTGYAGYAWEFKGDENQSRWQSSIGLVLDDNIDSYIKDVDYDAFEKLRDSIDDSKFIVMWFTKNWQEYYFNPKLIQRAMNKGKIPVFLYWYFGDDFAVDNPTEVVSKKHRAYMKMNQRIMQFLNKLDGEVVLLLEPEFNKQHVLKNKENSDLFKAMMDYSLDYFRANSAKDLKLYLGLSMNDNGSKYKNEPFDLCGYEHCALGDKHTWNQSVEILKSLSSKLDVVSFSLMLSPFSRGLEDPNIPQGYKNEKLGIGFLPERIANLSQYLYQELQKPVFLSHLVMASGRWEDTNQNQKIENNEVDENGWNKEIYETYSNFDYELFKKSGMFGLSLMNLFDNPKHDIGGYNYFLQNEHHLGLIATGTDAESLQPNDGRLRFKNHNGVDLIDLIYRD